MGKFCPDDFEPRPKDVEWAKFAFKISQKEADRQMELLRDREFRRNYTDWNRVYRNWMRKADELSLFKREHKHRSVEELTDDERKTDAQKAWEQMKRYGA